MERFSIVTGFENYKIFDSGKVFSIKHNRFLNPVLRKGYERVRLYKKTGEWKTFSVHQLVGIYFVNGHCPGLMINHKDGNKRNNHFTNLEWVNNSQNVRHAIDTGLKKTTEYQRQCAREVLRGNTHSAKKVINTENSKVYNTVKDAAKDLGVARSTLSGMLTGFRKNTTTIKYHN